MNLHFSFKKKKSLRKKLRLELSPRQYWAFLLAFFIVALALEITYFTWLFWKMNKDIDAPATPILETNAPKIHAMERTLTEVEAALRERTGASLSPSQTSSSVVQ